MLLDTRDFYRFFFSEEVKKIKDCQKFSFKTYTSFMVLDPIKFFYLLCRF